MLSKLTNLLSGKLLFIGGSFAVSYIGITSAYMWYQAEQLSTAQQTLGKLSQQLINVQGSVISLSETARRNQKAQADLLLKIQQVTASTGQFQQHLKRLKNENADMSHFLNTELPLALSKLQQRPGITGAEQFRAWLSTRDQMLLTTEHPPPGRGPTERQ